MNANAIIRASSPFFQKYVLSPGMPAKRHLAMMLLGLGLLGFMARRKPAA